MSGYAVFEGDRRIATGSRLDAAVAAQARLAQASDASLLIFDPEGRQIDFDLRGGPSDLASRLGEPPSEGEAAPRGRGRPKLGVTAREVTLLPRHWDWLAAQPGALLSPCESWSRPRAAKARGRSAAAPPVTRPIGSRR